MNKEKFHKKPFHIEAVRRSDGSGFNDYWFVEELNLTARRAKIFFEKEHPELKVKRIITYHNSDGL